MSPLEIPAQNPDHASTAEQTRSSKGRRLSLAHGKRVVTLGQMQACRKHVPAIAEPELFERVQPQLRAVHVDGAAGDRRADPLTGPAVRWDTVQNSYLSCSCAGSRSTISGVR
jgi:hypothetical protein